MRIPNGGQVWQAGLSPGEGDRGTKSKATIYVKERRKTAFSYRFAFISMFNLLREPATT